MPILITEEQMFDIRLLERNMKKGLFKDKDYQKFLKNLEDVADNADYIVKEIIFQELAEVVSDEASAENASSQDD